jgi:hypothetical protein
MSVRTEAATSLSPGEGVSAAHAAASASDTLTFTSTGQKRIGLIAFEVVTVHLHQDQRPGAGVAIINDGVHLYPGVIPGECDIESCEIIATAPFALGSAFRSLLPE